MTGSFPVGVRQQLLVIHVREVLDVAHVDQHRHKRRIERIVLDFLPANVIDVLLRQARVAAVHTSQVLLYLFRTREPPSGFYNRTYSTITAPKWIFCADYYFRTNPGSRLG